MSEPELKAGQQAALDGFFAWLFNPAAHELCISGPGGTGKTWLMGRMIDDVMPKYRDMCQITGQTPLYFDVDMTATTNKAAEVLGKASHRPTSTLQKLLGLGVRIDFHTGETLLVRKQESRTLYKRIIFVDEASMLNTELRKFLLELTVGCKIVYVGDHCQLAPVGEKISPVYASNLPFFELTEQVRNADQPALMQVCHQMRETVKTLKFGDIPVIPGVIDHLDRAGMGAELRAQMMNPLHNSRVLAFTNTKVNDVNRFIRKMRGMPADLTVGECVVNNTAILAQEYPMSVEDEFELLAIAPVSEMEITPSVKLKVNLCTVRGEHGTYENVPVPVDRAYFDALVKYYKDQKNWDRHYYLKNNFPDLRPRDACTVHKSQGSTYETVFVDLTDISKCFDKDTVARLLYVAFSRARTRVLMYGTLDPAYGRLIT